MNADFIIIDYIYDSMLPETTYPYYWNSANNPPAQGPNGPIPSIIGAINKLNAEMHPIFLKIDNIIST